MRPCLAFGADGPDAPDRPDPDHRHLRPALAHGHHAPGLPVGDGGGVASNLGCARHAKGAAPASPIMAQHKLVEKESVVRNGIASFPQIGNPSSDWLTIAKN